MTDYISLARLIENKKNVLCGKIEKRSLPSEAEKIKELCIDFVDNLTKKDAEYMKQLSLLEQDLISPVLKVMDALYASDIELSNKISAMFSQRSMEHTQHIQKEHKSSIKKEYGPALAGVAGGTLLATICKPTSWGVILMGSVIGAIIGKVLYGLYLDKGNNVVVEYGDTPNRTPEYKLTSEDAIGIVNALISAGECIDKVLLTYRRHLEILQDDFKKKEETYNLEKKYIGILENYQALLGNLSELGEFSIATDCIRKITQTLQKQGFKSVDYSEDTKGMFNTKEEDVDSVEQFAPAIVKTFSSKEILILKGDVIIPKTK